MTRMVCMTLISTNTELMYMKQALVMCLLMHSSKKNYLHRGASKELVLYTMPPAAKSSKLRTTSVAFVSGGLLRL